MRRSRPGRLTVELLEDRALLSAGDIDHSYANNGQAYAQTQLDDQEVTHDVAVDSQGRAVIVGTTVNYDGGDTFDFSITRILANGSLDTSFNGQGFNLIDFGQANHTDAAYAVSILS